MLVSLQAYPQAYPTLDPASSSQTSGASPWSHQGDSAAATPEQEVKSFP